MVGQVSSVVTPSSSRAMGRRARWSINGSVSKVATTVVGDPVSRWAMAAEAPMPASTHPSSATTRTGRSRRLPDGLAPARVERVEVGRLVPAHSASTSARARSPSRATPSANWSTPLRSPAAAPPA